MRVLMKRIAALEARRPVRLVVARWVEGAGMGWFGTAAVPVADIPRLTAEARGERVRGAAHGSPHRRLAAAS